MFGAPEYKGRNNRSWEKISRRSGTWWEPAATAKHESLSQPAGHQSPDVVKVGWTRLTRPCPYVICPALCLLSCQRRMHDSHFVHRYISIYIYEPSVPVGSCCSGIAQSRTGTQRCCHDFCQDGMHKSTKDSSSASGYLQLQVRQG